MSKIVKFWIMFTLVFLLLVAILAVLRIAKGQEPTSNLVEIESCKVDSFAVYQNEIVVGGTCDGLAGLFLAKTDVAEYQLGVETKKIVVEVQINPTNPWLTAYVVTGKDGREIMLWDAREEGTQILVSQHDNYSIDWSPNGKHLAFISNRDGNREVYSIGADGKDEKRWTATRHNEGQPKWLDNSNIVFVIEVNGNEDLCVDGDSYSDENNLYCFAKSNANDVDPSVSPDRRKILFASSETGNFEIYLYDIDQLKTISLTSSAQDDRSPVWTVSGIAWLCEKDICLMNDDGTNQRKVVKWTGEEKGIVSLTDGRIAYLSYTSKELPWQIFIYDPKTGKECQLTGYLRRTTLGETPRCSAN